MYFMPRDPDDEMFGGDGNGKCRRYPPILIAGIDEVWAEYIAGSGECEIDFFAQPFLASYEWCGEHKPIE